jgi:tRNA A22 N-methylase
VLIEEKSKFYEICKFERSETPRNYTDFEYRYGPIIIQSQAFKHYARIIIKRMDAILNKDLPEAMKNLVRQEREILLTYEN